MIAVDPNACEAEPIHVPGAIQPHGALIALDPRSSTITQASANCAEFFGIAPADLLGQSLSVLLGGAAKTVLAALHSADVSVREASFVDVHGTAFDVCGHRHDGVLILEFERCNRAAATSDAMLRSALARLQRPGTVSDVCAIAIEEVRKLTGFDRVLLYKFDDEGHGDVLEEAKADDVDAYLGHRFPASDIPRQARELYVLNWLRLIPDAVYTPIPLLPELRSDTGTALDLSFSTLRSVSPVHLEYLANMGVRASMSVSLVRAGKLWGLIACHHRVARHVSFAARDACEVIGRVVSLQIAALEEIESRNFRSTLEGLEAKLVDVMKSSSEEPALALLQRGDALLALAEAAGAAVCTGAGIRTVGVTPSQAQLTALVAWLSEQGYGSVLHSDRLAERFPPAADYAPRASGLLALSLPGPSPNFVLWFRPEVVRTVSWAGNPAKPATVHPAGARLHPRLSFETWAQVLRGRALPWRSAEVDAIEDLRRRAIEIQLGNQTARAEQAVRDRDETVAILSHDLKSPLQVIALAAGVLRLETAGSVRGEVTVERVSRAVTRMTRLIHDLLDLAKIEAGRFELSPAPCMVSRLLSDAFAMLEPLAEAKGVRLTWHGDGAAYVHADADRVFQALSNLVGNAVKFTPSGGTITVETQVEDGVVRFAVRDTGPGIVAVELAHIFDRYWQARRVRGAGSGLGLYIAKGIVEAHGGRLWAESTVGEGATFHFTLCSCAPLEQASSAGTHLQPVL